MATSQSIRWCFRTCCSYNSRKAMSIVLAVRCISHILSFMSVCIYIESANWKLVVCSLASYYVVGRQVGRRKCPALPPEGKPHIYPDLRERSIKRHGTWILAQPQILNSVAGFLAARVYPVKPVRLMQVALQCKRENFRALSYLLLLHT